MRIQFFTLVLTLQLAAGSLWAQESTNTVAAVKLEKHDKVLYRVEEDPSSGSKVVGISALGKAQVPVSMAFEDTVVTVDAAGKTLDELAEAIKGQLEGKYYKKATVKLTLVDKAQKVGQAIFMGETRGVVQIVPGEEITVATAIAKLGSSEFANLKKVELFRVDKSTGKQLDKQIIDVETVLKKGDRTKDVILQDEDRVNVPEKKFLFN
jgi:protein involved in polysaccharide export with SLBB domain